MFQSRPDPIQRTVLIDTFRSWHGDVEKLVPMAQAFSDGASRSGICLALGSIPVEEMTTRRAWKVVLSEWYRDAVNTGTCSAARWALQRWQMELPEIPSSDGADEGREWYVNSLGMTMLKIPSGQFARKDDEQDIEQRVNLSRSFFLSDHEVSVGLFEKFLDDDEAEIAEDWNGARMSYSLTDECPVTAVSWFDAALFCNWLSRREGLTPCYESRGQGHCDVGRSGQYGNGYRLPTEAEWEYACCAGTVTQHTCGEDESFLGGYAVYLANQTQPCGSRLPNCWGLFDMHGNVSEWCQDGFAPYFAWPEIEDPLCLNKKDLRAVRGGSFLGHARVLRSAYRIGVRPDDRPVDSGFRVARTSR
jgi:formylglycine-generating enzyme required for sulfatase activity